MNIDLSELTFIPELTHPCRWNGQDLEYGCVYSRDRILDRPNTPAGGLRAPFTIYVRACDTALADGRISIGDAVEVQTEGGNTVSCRVLDIRPIQGGCIALDCEARGSRAVSTAKR